jgi:hypothetical protein
MTQLSDLYDADKRARSALVTGLALYSRAPHPLTGVEYADGSIPDDTAGHVRCVACLVGRPCSRRRSRGAA